MYSYEIPKKIGYPRTIFYEDGFVLCYKDGRKISISTKDIERIEYVKPSLWHYLMASVWFGGVFPGRMEIYLTNHIKNSLLDHNTAPKMYLIKIAYKDILKLPEFYKKKMGLSVY